jgi:hypothetical protein
MDNPILTQPRLPIRPAKELDRANAYSLNFSIRTPEMVLIDNRSGKNKGSDRYKPCSFVGLKLVCVCPEELEKTLSKGGKFMVW